MTSDTKQAPKASILLIEDNPGDVRLVEEGFDQCQSDVDLEVVSDGNDALERIRGRPHEPPSLVLLDLNLPGMNGEQILDRLKSDPALRRIPVVVFTSSAAKEDVERMYELQANAYITKPNDAVQFFDAIERLESFWLCAASLPCAKV